MSVLIIFTLVPTAAILGGPDLHVDKGSTINLTCAVKYSPEPPAYIFWYHHEEVIIFLYSSSTMSREHHIPSAMTTTTTATTNVFFFYYYYSRHLYNLNCLRLGWMMFPHQHIIHLHINSIRRRLSVYARYRLYRTS